MKKVIIDTKRLKELGQDIETLRETGVITSDLKGGSPSWVSDEEAQKLKQVLGEDAILESLDD